MTLLLIIISIGLLIYCTKLHAERDVLETVVYIMSKEMLKSGVNKTIVNKDEIDKFIYDFLDKDFDKDKE